MTKRKFEGEAELEDFVKSKRRPTFDSFISHHLKDLSKWSTSLVHLKEQDLFLEWRNRFVQALASSEKQNLVLSASSYKFKKDRWRTILATATELVDMDLQYVLSGTKLMRDMNSRVLDNARAVAHSSSSAERPPATTAEPVATKTVTLPLQGIEETLYEIAYDYFAGNGIAKAKEKELRAIVAMNCDDLDHSLSLMKLGAKHLLKQDKTSVNQAIIKLSISRIFNLIDSRFEAIYRSNLPSPVWRSIECEARKMTDASESSYVSEDAIKVFKQVAEKESAKAMLKFIDKEKYILSSSDKEDNDEYTVLLLVEQVVRNFSHHQENDSEATCYRRFAVLLEILLDGTGITMVDGEKASNATKVNNAINNAYFGVDLSQYGRKIDLILCTLESTEICASEFKKETADDFVILQQQSKNLRTNASMLRHVLYPLNRELDMTMAIDFLGTNGYLYALQLFNDEFYIAKPITQLLYPKEPETLELFDDTLKALFYLKHFLLKTAKFAKKPLSQRKINNSLPTLNISTPTSSASPSTPPSTISPAPFVFSSPQHR